LSQAQFARLLPVFSTIYQATQQHMYETGVATGTRRRKPGGGSKGHLPTMAETLPFVLSSYKTYPPFAGRATQCGMARAKAQATLHKLSPLLYDTLVPLERMPSRELAPPEAVKAAWQGGDRRLIDAPERAYHRSAEAAKPRAPYRGTKPAYAEEDGQVAPEQVSRLSGADV
jgi:hypothetical protein